MQQVPCGSCGRMHRWREEMAGTEFLCHCGEWVYCPAPGDKEYVDEVEEISKADALAKQNEFEVDHGFEHAEASGGGTRGGSAVVAGEDIEDISSEVGEIDVAAALADEGESSGGKSARLRARKRRVRSLTGRGMLGLSAFGELCVWMVGSLIGFAFTVLAVMNPSHYEYIALAVVTAPVSWWMLWRSYNVWKRGRRLVIAIDEQLTRDNAAG